MKDHCFMLDKCKSDVQRSITWNHSEWPSSQCLQRRNASEGVEKRETYFSFFLFLAVLGLHCCTRLFSSCSKWGLLIVVVCGLLIAVASLIAEHGFQQLWHAGSVVVAHGLQSAGSVVVVRGLSCSAACGMFPDQGSNPCPLHWQADS